MLAKIWFDPTTWTFQLEENQNATDCFKIDMDQEEYDRINLIHKQFEESQTKLQQLLIDAGKLINDSIY